MASFRAHISLGIAMGILGVMGLVSLTLFEAPGFLMILWVAAVLGSVLPDMDSDSGIPFHVSFGSLSLVAATLTASSAYQETPTEFVRVLLWGIGTLILVYFGIGFVFKRFTRHRGMAHSLPAALVAGLLTFFLASHFSFSDQEAFVLGVAMTAGYVGHLILDELYAAVNFHGTPFLPNKALGSALKLYGNETLPNLFVFGTLILLLAGNVGRFTLLAEHFWKSIHQVS